MLPDDTISWLRERWKITAPVGVFLVGTLFLGVSCCLWPGGSTTIEPVVVAPPPPEPKNKPIEEPPHPALEPKAVERRTPLPDPGAQEKAERLLKEVFKEEYAQDKAQDLAAFAAKLLRQAEETREEPARFVMLSEASRLAARAGAAELALKAVDQLDREFAVNGLELRVAVIEAAAGATPPESSQSFVHHTLAVAARAVELDDYDAALALLELAQTAARKTQDAELQTAVAGQLKQVAQQCRHYAEFKEARAKLAQQAKDPEANLVAGKYLCLWKENWKQGLRCLLMGSDPVLQNLARQELAGPDNAEKQTGLADGWWSLADSYANLPALNLRKRALYWYLLAEPELSGITRQKAAARITAVREQLGIVKTGESASLRSIPAHAGPVTAVLFSPDNLRIVSGSEDGWLRLWDVASGKELRREQINEAVRSVALAPDGRRVCCITTTRLLAWDFPAMKELGRLGRPTDTQWDSAGFCTPDGLQILVGYARGNMTQVDISAPGGWTRTPLSLSGDKFALRHLVCAPESRLAAIGLASGEVCVWDVREKSESQRFQAHAGEVLRVALSADGKRLASSGTDKSVRVWDTRSGRELSRLRGHTGAVEAVAFSPDGQRVITGGDDMSVRIWEAATGKELRCYLVHTGRVNSVAFSPDGKRAVSGSADRTVRLWDVAYVR